MIGLLLVLVGLVGSVYRPPMSHWAAASSEIVQAVNAKVQKLPLHFIENHGQTDAQVAYYIQGRLSAYFTREGLTLGLQELPPPVDKAADPAERIKRSTGREARLQEPPPKRWAVQVRFVGAAQTMPHGGVKTASTVNYIKGSQSEWKTGLPTYSDIIYSQVWPGVDVVYSGEGGQIKTTFLVSPGSDPGQIHLAYQGASAVKLTDTGKLEVQTPVGGFGEESPLVYQDIDGKRVAVDAHYSLTQTGNDEWQYGFVLGGYDRSRPLVIDPVLYSTYLGGSGVDLGWSIAVDGSGNAYVTGLTPSADFPTVNAKLPNLTGNYDAFVFKLASDGQTVLYSTFLGGSGDDQGWGIAVDGSGNAYVTGLTTSSNFPTFNAKYPNLVGGYDAFLLKLGSDGQTVHYSTYLGGNGYDQGWGIAADEGGNAYVTGITYSSNFPAVNAKFPTLIGSQDAFIFKLSSNGQTVLYSTYLGGSGNNEFGSSIAVDVSGNAYVTGNTMSSDFPTANAKYPNLKGTDDAFICKLSSDGQTVLYSTYLGGSNYERGQGIAVDGSGNAYVTGQTGSPDFPTTHAKYPNHLGGLDAFVFKLSGDGQTILYSTYLGGNGNDYGWGIAADSGGNAYVTGITYSSDFPAVNANYPSLRGTSDAFLFKLGSDGQTVLHSTYLGGSLDDNGYGIAVDGSANAYVTGDTKSADFPTSATEQAIISYDPTYQGGGDAFIVKINSPQSAYDLTVNISGSGTVVSNVSAPGINCPGICSNSFRYGSSVTLASTPAPGMHLTSWSGDCNGAGSTCQITMDQPRSVGASFAPNPVYSLAVGKTGSGSGTVTSNPVGIDCGGTCSFGFQSGTQVSLTAAAVNGSTFNGWSGACSGTGTCVVTLNAAATVTAEYAVNSYLLTVGKTGSGSGTVTSNPVGIDCGGTCSYTFLHGTQVSLTASAINGSTFTGWGGACSGAGACVVTLNAAATVTAEYAVNSYLLTVGKTGSGSGSGTVTSNPDGIDCGGTCSYTFLHGTQVSLTASAINGSTFTGWGGACSGSGVCVVTLNAATTVTADYAAFNSNLLTVGKTGSGSGTVTSNPVGIDCGSSCSYAFLHGTQVSLSPVASNGSTFIGWGGACSGTGACVVTLNAAATVTADYAVNSYLLTVGKTGSGSGTVTSNPVGIDCGSSCSYAFLHGTQVSLISVASNGSTFTGWGGACSGTGACVVTLNAAATVTAEYAINSKPTIATLDVNGTLLKIGLTAGSNLGKNADWWFVALSPWGHWYSYVYPNTWVDIGTDLSKVIPSHQGPLNEVSDLALFDTAGLPSGTYALYFGVDTNMNGKLDYDQLTYSQFLLTQP